MADSAATLDPEARLEELIAGYLQAVQAGETPDRADLLARHPDLAADLEEFFADHDWMVGNSWTPTPLCIEKSLHDSQRSLGTTLIGDAVAPDPRSRVREVRDTSSPGSFGDYELLEEIGRGGMGVIYRARQLSLNRVVAIKMILSSQLASQDDVDRFCSEAETAAALEHPSIVPIYEVGEWHGQHFYTMPCIEGPNLGKVLEQERLLGPPIVAELVRRVAEAVAYAHDRGIVHRDLKPANILLAPSTPREGVPLTVDAATAHYQPRVTDFGLAKRIENASELTGSGHIVGTASYMPPEQAAGRSREVGPHSDIYSLGAVLYCLLTGRPPFRSANVLDTLKQVLDDEPVPPRQLNRAVPKDLETICLMCLQKSPTRRYASALDLADDLQRFRTGEPVLARPTGRVERAWKWVKRRPLTATLLIVGLIAAMALAGLAVSVRYQHQREQLLYNRSVVLAHQCWKNGELVRAQQLLDDVPEQLKGSWEWEYLNRLCRTGVLQTLDPDVPTSYLYDGLGPCVDFDRSGMYVGAAAGKGLVVIWHLDSSTEHGRLAGHTDKVLGMAFSPVEDLVVTGARDRTVRLWSLEDQKELSIGIGHEASVQSVDFSPDGTFVVSGDRDGTVQLWSVPGLEPVAVAKPLSTEANLITTERTQNRSSFDANPTRFSPDGQLIAAARKDGSIRLLSFPELNDAGILQGHAGIFWALSFSPDGRFLATAGDDSTVRIWDVENRREHKVCEGHVEGVIGVDFSPDGGRIVSSGQNDRTLRIWDVATGRLLLTTDGGLPSHTRLFGQVAFHSDGRHVALATDNNIVRIWSVPASTEFTDIEIHSGSVQCLALGAQGQIVTAGEEGLVRITNPQSGNVIQEFQAHDGRLTALVCSPASERIATAAQDGVMRLWDSRTGKLLCEYQPGKGEIHDLAFSPDGRQLATARHDGTIALIDTQDGRVVRDLVRRTESGQATPAACVAFSPDGRRLAVGGWDKSVCLYDPQRTSQNPIERLNGHAREVLCVSFSADGGRLVSGDRDGRIFVWDASSGRRVAELKGHAGSVTRVLFNRAGDRIVSSGWDGYVTMWDLITRQDTLSLNSHHGRTYGVAFSPDDTFLASANQDGTVTLWGR